ncbi:MAG TPA: class I SAM-dependent methyltransferase [Nitrospirales bacterium]|nr:class I SAM-dependent methyltransferase [Nitrospirales bacterium]
MATDHLEEQREIEQAWRTHLLSEPSEKAFREAYDAVHAAMRRRPGRETIYAASLSRVDRSFLGALNSARRILDIGAGNGRFALAASPGRSVVAVDISTEAFTAMRDLATGQTGPTLCQASALHLPFGACTFDAVVSLDLVEHLHPDHLDPHLAEVYRVLVPGGRYLLHTPSSLHGATSLGLHLREYRLRELGRAARQARFQPRWLCLNFARFGWVKTVPGWLWSAVAVWEAIWNVAGSAGLRQIGGRWYVAGIPDVDVDLMKPGS